MGATPAFEGWGGPSRILRAMGSTGIGIRAQMRLKRQKPVKLIKAFFKFLVFGLVHAELAAAFERMQQAGASGYCA